MSTKPKDKGFKGKNLLESEEYTKIDSQKLFLHSHNNISALSSSQVEIPEEVEQQLRKYEQANANHIRYQ